MEGTRKKHRILHIIGSLEVGGTEKWLVKLLRHWNTDIFEPLVIAFGDGKLREELANLGVEPIILRKEGGHHLRFLYRLLTVFSQLKPDLVHCRNAFPAVIYGGIAARITDLPLVVSIHGHAHEDNLRVRAWYKMQDHSDRVIAVSKSIRKALITSGSVEPRRITVIHNGIDVTRIGREPKGRKKAELGLDNSELIVGCVGNLKPVKGHKYLIKALPLVLESLSNVRLVLAGDGPLRNELELLASDLNVKDKIMFLGYRADVYELMPVFDIFVLPSLSEGLSNVLLEAMAAEKAVVATNVGGNSEIVENGKTGILVPSQNSRALAEAVISLLDNEAKRREIGRLGLLKVKREFQLTETIRKYEKVYLNILGNTYESR